MDVGRHLRPLLGQRTRLAFGDEIPHEAEPPRAEDDDARRDDQGGAPDGPERGHGGVALDQEGDPARRDEKAGDDANDEPAPANPVMSVPTEQGHDLIVDERLLGRVGVAPDEDDHADGQEGRPAEEPDERDMQGAGDELHRDQQRDEDGGDRADPPAIGDDTCVDVFVLPLQRDQHPGQGVDEHHHTAADGQQDNADTHPHGVDPRRPRDGATNAAEHAVVGGTAHAPQPPPEVVMAAVVLIGPRSVAMGPVAVAPVPVPPAPIAAGPSGVGRWGGGTGAAAGRGTGTGTGTGTGPGFRPHSPVLGSPARARS